MSQMTQSQLGDFIKETVGPELKALVAKEVAPLVEEAITRSAERLKAPTGAAAAILTTPPAEKPAREKGIAFARVLGAAARAKFDGSGRAGMLEYLKSQGDGDIADNISKAMAAGVATSGGYLVPPQYANEVIELLRAATVIRKAGVPTITMPTGTFGIPKITGGSTAYYIGENANITPGDLATGNVVLTFKKLAAVVPVSNDLLRYSQPSADAIIRGDVVRALQVAEDAAMLRGNGLAGSPKGLRYWVNASNLLDVTTGGVSLANATTDLGRCILALKTNNIPLTKPVWLLAPRSAHYLKTVQTTVGAFVFRDEMLRGTLWGYPFFETTSIPVNLTDLGGTDESEVTLVDMDEMILGESQTLIVDASSEAAYYDGANVVSAYSKDQTVVRAIEEHDFAARRDTAIAVMRGVRWGV